MRNLIVDDLMDLVEFDDKTNEWFKNQPFEGTTLAECKKCGLWYKPSLGHECKLEE